MSKADEAQVQKTRVMLVDDHTLFRKGLRALLETQREYLVVGEAANGQEAIEMATVLEPHIILMDIDMPVMNGLEATAYIMQRLPEAKIMILTVSDYSDQVFGAIKNGASGYLLKNLDPEQFFEMLDKARDGEAAINGLVAAKILDEFRNRLKDDEGQTVSESERLSDREIEVLQYLTRGMANKEIAEAISVTTSTVKAHIGNIMNKLHLRNRIECAVYAVTEGLVETDILKK